MKEEFDKLFRDKLNNLEAPFQKGHWDLFEQQFEEALSADPDAVSSSDSFDQLARQELNNLQPDFNPHHWDLFESQLDAADAADADRLLKRKLEQVQAPYDPSHWDLMAAHIDHVFTLGQTILRYKLAEAWLMLLLLLALFQYVPVQDLSPEKAPQAEATLPAAVPPTHSEPSTVVPDRSAAIASPASFSPMDAPSASTHSLHEKPLAALPLPALSERRIQPMHPTAAPSEGGPRNAHLTPGALPDTPEFFPSEAHAGALDPMAPNWKEVRSAFTSLLMPLDGAPTPPKAVAAPGHHLRIGVFGGGEYNYVRFPYDEVFKIGPRTMDSIGYSLGFTMGFQWGRFELETGGNYSMRSYRPLLPTQKYGTFDYIVIETYERTKYEFLEVPLAANYRFWHPGSSWNAYMRLGMTGKFLINSVYEIEQQEIYDFANSLAPSMEERMAVYAKSKLNQKRFPEGIAESRSLEDNMYLSAVLGLGIERHLSAHLSVYFQPSYQYPLLPNDFGPNNERIHTLTFRFGTRFNVW